MLRTVARYVADHPRHPVLDLGPCHGHADAIGPVGAVPPERVERFPEMCDGCGPRQPPDDARLDPSVRPRTNLKRLRT